ncbi:uncharacterized protein LOC126382553 [Epinephelus moara]|uniref:uncharacterized protein LOC126382553 n=1 Tax=Epinephelus moara TaxID=300413 RepID=UPI00214E5726|nr:uncharacterized protein LOC126382553 [Epinephelus moara]
MSVFVILGLLVCTEAQGSSAVTPVFVKKGEDVLLKIMKADELQKFNFLTWKFNASNVLVVFTPNNDPHVDPNYTGRIEFSVENYSVKLKNLQKTDSGVYTAHVTRIPKEQKVAEYSVTVQDPVSPVDLTVDSVSNSSNSCNVTVTCRTQDSHINSTFRCVDQTCSQEGGEQSKVITSGASLQVYLDLNGSIICNHSNQVSWTENKEIIEHLCPRHAGSSAVTPVFVKKGEDVLLKIMKADELQKFAFFSWKFNASGILVTLTPKADPEINPRYTKRIEVSVENYSVKLKNLQKTDSGVYTAHVLRIPTEVKVAEYKVTVQDPVSPVDLTVDSVSRSSKSCNITVTCRTQDSHINSTFRCDTQTCSQEGGEQSKVITSGASLQVYLDLNGSIICNHSNQVSWTENKEIIEHLCPRHADSESLSPGISVCLVKTVVFSVGLIIMVSAVITVHLMEKLKKKK